MACRPSQKNLWDRTFLFSQRERFPFPFFTVLFRGQILSQSASDFQICQGETENQQSVQKNAI